jgi:phosphatidylglycerophosphate synthase
MESSHATEAAVAVYDPCDTDTRYGRLRPGLAAGMIFQALLLATLAAIVVLSGVGLGAAGSIVAASCVVITHAGLARGLARYRLDRVGPAHWVTLARATLAVGIAALVADSFDRPVPVALVVSLTVVALALDAVDGWVARRTRTAGTLGARFDGEVDAFLILVLSVYVARSAGVWVLAIGAARYAFLVAGWRAPWMRAPLPARYWRKVVAATQGIVLTIAAAGVLPSAVIRVALVAALVLLGESFARDVWWLRRRRDATPAVATPDSPRRGRVRTGLAAALTILAGLLVWIALVAPDQPIRLVPGALVRIPLEGLVLIAVGVVLPATGRRVMVWLVGPALGLVVILKILNIGFYGAFDRAFDPYQDVSYAGRGSETLRVTFGSTEAHLITAAVIVFVVTVLLIVTLAVRRLTRVAAGHRIWSLRTVAALGAVWVLCWALGARLVSHTPIASTSAAALVADDVSAARADIRDSAVYAQQIRQDRFRNTPTDQLLTGLRGKDVLLTFVESYGKVAVQGSSFSPEVDAALADGTKQLQTAGFSARSAFLTSPTFGGISWLAHSTLQSGTWVNTPRRYDQLMATNRFTLSGAFKQAGWRTVSDVPSNDRAWPQGTSFYHFDKLYDRRNVGYHGPQYAYASMPDQYTYAALQRLELAKRHRRPLFAEIDTVSSHEPWTRIPRMIAWRRVGNGSIFNSMPVAKTSDDSLSLHAAWEWLSGSSAPRVQAAYGQSIVYSLNTLVSFVKRSADRNLVLVVLGDHEPWEIVSGKQPSHDVPISIIARDPAVLKRIAGWGWNAGLRPSPRAPVWPMSAFRDRFLGAFDSQPATR